MEELYFPTLNKVTEILQKDEYLLQNCSELAEVFRIKNISRTQCKTNPREALKCIVRDWIRLQGTSVNIGILARILNMHQFKYSCGKLHFLTIFRLTNNVNTPFHYSDQILDCFPNTPEIIVLGNDGMCIVHRNGSENHEHLP